MASVKHICSVVKLSVQQLIRTLKRRDILWLDTTCHVWLINSLSEMRKWHELFIIFMKGILLCENTVYKDITFKYTTVYCCISLQGGIVSAKNAGPSSDLHSCWQNIGRVIYYIHVFSRLRSHTFYSSYSF